MPDASCSRVVGGVIFSPAANLWISSLMIAPLPIATRGFQHGSRLHHWLPRPSLVPNFPRTGVEASTSCPMYLRPPWHHKGWYCASLNCGISYECVSPCLPGRVRRNSSQNTPSTHLHH